jgi:hypothetical protein
MDDKALKSVEELFKIIVATAGIVLTLLWGLTQRSIPQDVLSIIRIASIVLVISIGGSLLGYQFIVTQLQNDNNQASRHPSVAICFFCIMDSILSRVRLLNCGYLENIVADD